MIKSPRKNTDNYQPKWLDYGVCGGCGQQIHVKAPTKIVRCPVCNKDLKLAIAEEQLSPQVTNYQSVEDAAGINLG